jgi:3-oxoacyl-[acyl-carrier-protein] synthase III
MDQYHDLYGAVVSLARPGGQLLVRKRDELESAYLEGAPGVFAQLLEREGLRADEVDLVIPSQISAGFPAQLGPALGVGAERVVDVHARFGDTLSTSWFLAYCDALARGQVPEGSKVVFMTFGSGVTIGAAAYYH